MPAIPVVAGVIGYIGVSAAVATFAATVIVGAVVGAAVGGLAAAVTGGSIGKGILFGAIGGAVMGGISGALSWTAQGAAYGTEAATGGAATDAAFATTEGTSEAVVGGGGSTGGGMLGGSTGQSLGGALVSTGGQMLMKGFDNTSEIAQAEAEKNRQASMELAKLQSETQLKIEAMRSPGGGSNGDARHSADIQLLNARESRAQAEAFKNQDLNELEKARLRRAESLSGATIASTEGVETTGAKSINEQAMENTNKAYPTGNPQVLSGGVLNYA